MRIIFKIIVCILNIVYLPFKLFPIKKRVTIISRQADKPTEDISMLSENLRQKGINVKCLCKKIGPGLGGKLKYIGHMFVQMYYLATSKVIILDSYCICASVLKHKKETKIIQMWHALGSLKRFGYSIVGEEEGSSIEVAEGMRMHKNYDYVLTSGESALPNFAEAFGYKDNLSVMKIMSLPRVDKLTDKKLASETIDRIYKRYPNIEGKKLVVYAPTFRKGRDISKEIEELAKEFEGEEYIFCLKKHPLMEVSCKDVLCDNEFTTLEMLYAADYVICDYSAIIYEAAILRKPLFFYTFDYDSYGADRDFYIDYMKEIPGLKSKSPVQIANAIKKEEYNLDAVSEFSKKYVKYQSGCTDRLSDFVIDTLLRKEMEKSNGKEAKITEETKKS